jgi:sortase A
VVDAPQEGGVTRRRYRLAFLALIVAGFALGVQAAVVPAKAAVAQVLLDRAFERSVAEGAPVKAWPWADAAPVARISAPRLGVSQVVLSGGSGEAMAFGPTLLPGGGEPGRRGTAVYAAHRDTHFRFLRDLKAGDVVVVEGLDGRKDRYRVTGGWVVHKDRFGVDRAARTPSIALTTCWPFDGDRRGPLRYVVRATRATGVQRSR